MQEQSLVRWVDEQLWLDRVGDSVAGAVSSAFERTGEGGRAVKNFLHGTWLGHPLHPVLTDIPLGAWTAALVLDAMDQISGKDEFGKGADAAVAVGLVGAVAAACAGIADWQATDGRVRRVGMMHGLLNTGGALLYGASLMARRSGQRETGRGLSLLGYATAAVSAWIGGHLVYAEQVGVDHTRGQQFPDEFKTALPDAELGEGEMKRVDVEGTALLVARRDGQVYCIAETCTHLGGPLSEGKFEGCAVQCPWHGSRFSLEDGSVLDGPAAHPAPHMEVRIREGQIEVRLNPPRV